MHTSGLTHHPGPPLVSEDLASRYPGKKDIITSQKLPVLSGYLYAYLSTIFYAQRNNLNDVPIAENRRIERINDNQLLTSMHLPVLPGLEQLALQSRASPAVKAQPTEIFPTTIDTSKQPFKSDFSNQGRSYPQTASRLDFSPKEEQLPSPESTPLDERLLDSQLIKDLMNRERMLESISRADEAVTEFHKLVRTMERREPVKPSPQYDCAWIGLSERATSGLRQPVLNARWKNTTPPQTCRPYFAKSRECTDYGAKMIFTASLCAFLFVVLGNLLPPAEALLRWFAGCPAMIVGQLSKKKTEVMNQRIKPVVKTRTSRGSSKFK